MSIEQLAADLRASIDKAPQGEIVVSIHLFGIRRANDLRGVSLKELVEEARVQRSYATEIRKGMNLAEYVRLK